MDIFELIRSRRSIRKYTGEPVSDEVITKIIEAGTWAPSGLNNQPWKFGIVKDDDLKKEISGLTHYSRIVKDANALIAVFLDLSISYDRTKDAQAIGAFLLTQGIQVELGWGQQWYDFQRAEELGFDKLLKAS